MSFIEFDVKGKALFQEEKHKISILRCCEELCKPWKKTELRTRNYYSLHFIISGAGTLRYVYNGENVEVVLQKGDSFLLYEGECYEYFPDTDRPWGYDWVDFSGENVEDLFKACGYVKEKPYTHLKHFDLLRPYVSEFIDAYDASEMQNLKCSGYFTLLLCRLIDSVRKSAIEKEEIKSKKFQRLRSVLIFMNNNYRLDLDVETVARAECVSQDYLKHLFPEFLHMSMTEYLNRFRISSACEKFQQSDFFGIEEVAAEVGYNDPKYFARVFKKIKGVSASEYRKNCKDDDPFLWLKEKNIDFR